VEASRVDPAGTLTRCLGRAERMDHPAERTVLLDQRSAPERGVQRAPEHAVRGPLDGEPAGL